jgi:1,4-alpha-glucan branching enzyme
MTPCLISAAIRIYRKHHHDDMTFGLLYAFSENFVLPISHDEVVHGKGSMLNQDGRATNGRNLPICAPITALCGAIRARSCLFMGQEFAQRGEWSEAGQLDWDHLDDPRHHGMQDLVRDLNRLHAETAGPACT